MLKEEEIVISKKPEVLLTELEKSDMEYTTFIKFFKFKDTKDYKFSELMTHFVFVGLFPYIEKHRIDKELPFYFKIW